jgi:hypothetical protein
MVKVLEASGICDTGLAARFKIYVSIFVGWYVGREVVPVVSYGFPVWVKELE